jgi:uncharacterized RDD family membrane protein YckC
MHEASRAAAGSRAAQAAARVAARYANAPSYNDWLTAFRAAETASQAALEAHAAAESVLASLEAAPLQKLAWEPQPVPEAVSHPEPAAAAPQESFFSEEAAWFFAQQTPAPEPEPVAANLIQFPRPMVATRKVRPRLAEGPLAEAAPTGQLSIFEVEPATVSTEPAPPVAEEPAAPAWMREQWPVLEPDPQPEEELRGEPDPQALPGAALEPASAGRRLLAIALDAVLIAAAFLATAALAMAHLRLLPGPRIAVLAAALCLFVLCAAYQALFMTAIGATPGMSYAGIVLTTFDGCEPTRAQRLGRLLTLVLSVLPLGLGLIWALFDETHFTWHDRLSRTCLSRR